MSMHITDELLCAYLDDELDAAERARVEQALEQNLSFKNKLANWTAQTGKLRDALGAGLDEPLPDAWLQLANRLAPAAKAMPSPQPEANPAAAKLSWTARLMHWMPAPRLAACLALAILFGVFIGRDIVPRLDMDGQLVRLASVAHHVYSPDKRQPVEVKAEDPTLTAWISKRLGAKVFAPSVSGFRFMGGRLLAGAEEPAAQFMYEETSGKRLTVFVRTEGAAGRSAAPKCNAYRGVSVCYWYSGGVAYALAGEVPESRLAMLVESAAASIRVASTAK